MFPHDVSPWGNIMYGEFFPQDASQILGKQIEKVRIK